MFCNIIKISDISKYFRLKMIYSYIIDLPLLKISTIKIF
nr:MAG TPA: hypothetical protein [Crassvirales sp.]